MVSGEYTEPLVVAEPRRIYLTDPPINVVKVIDPVAENAELRRQVAYLAARLSQYEDVSVMSDADTEATGSVSEGAYAAYTSDYIRVMNVKKEDSRSLELKRLRQALSAVSDELVELKAKAQYDRRNKGEDAGGPYIFVELKHIHLAYSVVTLHHASLTVKKPYLVVYGNGYRHVSKSRPFKNSMPLGEQYLFPFKNATTLEIGIFDEADDGLRTDPIALATLQLPYGENNLNMSVPLSLFGSTANYGHLDVVLRTLDNSSAFPLAKLPTQRVPEEGAHLEPRDGKRVVEASTLEIACDEKKRLPTGDGMKLWLCLVSRGGKLYLEPEGRRAIDSKTSAEIFKQWNSPFQAGMRRRELIKADSALQVAINDVKHLYQHMLQDKYAVQYKDREIQKLSAKLEKTIGDKQDLIGDLAATMESLRHEHHQNRRVTTELVSLEKEVDTAKVSEAKANQLLKASETELKRARSEQLSMKKWQTQTEMYLSSVSGTPTPTGSESRRYTVNLIGDEVEI